MAIFNKNLANRLYICYLMKAYLSEGGYGMSRVCAVSGKKALSGNRRSHSLRATRRTWGVNLQKVHMVIDGKPQTVKVSARALKTLKSKNAKAVNA